MSGTGPGPGPVRNPDQTPTAPFNVDHAGLDSDADLGPHDAATNPLPVSAAPPRTPSPDELHHQQHQPVLVIPRPRPASGPSHAFSPNSSLYSAAAINTPLPDSPYSHSTTGQRQPGNSSLLALGPSAYQHKDQSSSPSVSPSLHDDDDDDDADDHVLLMSDSPTSFTDHTHYHHSNTGAHRAATDDDDDDDDAGEATELSFISGNDLSSHSNAQSQSHSRSYSNPATTTAAASESGTVNNPIDPQTLAHFRTNLAHLHSHLSASTSHSATLRTQLDEAHVHIARQREQHAHELDRVHRELARSHAQHTREMHLATETLASLKMALAAAEGDRDQVADENVGLARRLQDVLDRLAGVEDENGKLKQQLDAQQQQQQQQQQQPPQQQKDWKARATTAERASAQLAEDLAHAKSELASATARVAAAEGERDQLVGALGAKSDMHCEELARIEAHVRELQAAVDRERGQGETVRRALDEALGQVAELRKREVDLGDRLKSAEEERDVCLQDNRDLVDQMKDWKDRAKEMAGKEAHLEGEVEVLRGQVETAAAAASEEAAEEDKSMESEVHEDPSALTTRSLPATLSSPMDHPLVANLHEDRQRLQDALAASRATANAHASALQGQLDAAQERAQLAEENVVSLERELDSAHNHVHQLESELEKLHDELDTLRTQLQHHQQQQQQVPAQPAPAPPMRRNSSSTSSIPASELNDLMRQLRSAETDRQHMQDRLSVVTGQSAAVMERLELVTRERDDARVHAAALNTTAEELRAQLEDALEKAMQTDEWMHQAEARGREVKEVRHELDEALERVARLERQCADAAATMAAARDAVAGMYPGDGDDDGRGDGRPNQRNAAELRAEYEEELAQLHDEIRMLNAELDQALAQRDDAKRAADRAGNRAQRAEQEKVDLNRELAAAQAVVRKAEHNLDKIERMHEMERVLGETEEQRDVAVERAQELAARADQLEADLCSVSGRVADLTAENGQLTEDSEEMRKKVAEVNQDLATARDELEHLRGVQQRLDEVERQLTAATRELEDTKTNLDMAVRDKLLAQAQVTEAQNHAALATRRARTASSSQSNSIGPASPVRGGNTGTSFNSANMASLVAERDAQLKHLQAQYEEVVSQFRSVAAKSTAMKRAVSSKMQQLEDREREAHAAQLQFVALEKAYLDKIEGLHQTIAQLRGSGGAGSGSSTVHGHGAVGGMVGGAGVGGGDVSETGYASTIDGATEDGTGGIRLAPMAREIERLRDQLHERDLALMERESSLEKMRTELVCMQHEMDRLRRERDMWQQSTTAPPQPAAATTSATASPRRGSTSVGSTSMRSTTSKRGSTPAPAVSDESLRQMAQALTELKREYTQRVAERDELEVKISKERKYFAKLQAEVNADRARLQAKITELLTSPPSSAGATAHAAGGETALSVSTTVVGPSASNLEARVNKYRAKYVREAMMRAALIQQKAYLTSVLRTYKQSEETSWRLIQDLGIPRPSHRPGLMASGDPRSALRTAIFAVRATIRLRNLRTLSAKAVAAAVSRPASGLGTLGTASSRPASFVSAVTSSEGSGPAGALAALVGGGWR